MSRQRIMLDPMKERRITVAIKTEYFNLIKKLGIEDGLMQAWIINQALKLYFKNKGLLKDGSN